MFVVAEHFLSDVVEEYRDKIWFPQMVAHGIHRKPASF